MLSTQSLRDQLDKYAEGALSSDALEEWLASESWDMRRWVPSGVQRLIEAIQAAFRDHSDGRASVEELRDLLLQRREQLHRALQITKQIEARYVRPPSIQAVQSTASVAKSDALMIQVDVVAA